VTVRQRIDQLAADPPVRDLGYAADQRLVAGALLGLQLLADEIDALKAGFADAETRQQRPFEVVTSRDDIDDDDLDDDDLDDDDLDDDDLNDDDIDDDDETDRGDIADIVEQLAELTAQMKKLTKAVRRDTEDHPSERKKKMKPKK
jgi:hypothetical protein